MSVASSPHPARIRHLTPVPPLHDEEVTDRWPALVAVPPLPATRLGSDPTSGIPELRSDYVQTLAAMIFEVVEGARTVTQLGASITLEAARQLGLLRSARQDQMTVLRQRPRLISRTGPVRIDRPRPGIAEAASVVYAGSRGRAVALRLEWIHQRWRVTEVAVL